VRGRVKRNNYNIETETERGTAPATQTDRARPNAAESSQQASNLASPPPPPVAAASHHHQPPAPPPQQQQQQQLRATRISLLLLQEKHVPAAARLSSPSSSGAAGDRFLQQPLPPPFLRAPESARARAQAKVRAHCPRPNPPRLDPRPRALRPAMTGSSRGAQWRGLTHRRGSWLAIRASGSSNSGAKSLAPCMNWGGPCWIKKGELGI
jgi:hypothetical protein